MSGLGSHLLNVPFRLFGLPGIGRPAAAARPEPAGRFVAETVTVLDGKLAEIHAHLDALDRHAAALRALSGDIYLSIARLEAREAGR